MTLWTTISQFYDKFALWMNGPFYKLNPEEVESETNDAFRRVRSSIVTNLMAGTLVHNFAATRNEHIHLLLCRFHASFP